MLARTSVLRAAVRGLSTKSIPPPRLFSYEQVIANIHVSDAVEAIESAFGALAKGKVCAHTTEQPRDPRACARHRGLFPRTIPDSTRAASHSAIGGLG